MNRRVNFLTEPPLEFRYGQPITDPHDGLAMFGPYDADFPSHPKNISYAVIGTQYGTEAFGAWSSSIQGPIAPGANLDARLWPTFPGFEAAFACTWPSKAARVTHLNPGPLFVDSRDKDPNKRAARVVERYLSGIETIRKRDDPIDVVICVVPDIV